MFRTSLKVRGTFPPNAQFKGDNFPALFRLYDVDDDGKISKEVLPKLLRGAVDAPLQDLSKILRILVGDNMSETQVLLFAAAAV